MTELLIKELSLSVIFLWLSVKAFHEKGKNLRDLPILNQEARGYFTSPSDLRVGDSYIYADYQARKIYDLHIGDSKIPVQNATRSGSSQEMPQLLMK